MAMMKFANATVKNPQIGLDGWNSYRQACLLQKGTQFSSRSASIAIENYSPDEYLLTHCTIIASVDVDEPLHVKTGKAVQSDDGQTINRPYAGFLIKPECSQYINANGDAWERSLLMATHKTFVGAENYVEHIQIPELSKGKIIDAVARDLGDTVYVDILVATDKKHKDLVAQIESGELNTLSMGCTIAFSICTKCGNVAEDDTKLCNHVKYEKGNKFISPDGKIRVVAELCGHIEDPESVAFIEASWVGNPAFKGAVMRNILEWGNAATKTPTSYEKDKLSELIQNAHTATVSPSEEWTQFFMKTASLQIKEEVSGLLRTANAQMRDDLLATMQDLKKSFNFDDEEEGGGEEEEAPKPKGSPLDQLTKDLKEKIRDKALRELKEELNPEPAKVDMPEAEAVLNDSIIESEYKVFASRYAKELGASQVRSVYAALRCLKSNDTYAKYKDRFSTRDVVAAFYIYDRDVKSQTLDPKLYVCLATVGNAHEYGSLKRYLNACQQVMGRKVTVKEAKTLVARGVMLPNRKN